MGRGVGTGVGRGVGGGAGAVMITAAGDTDVNVADFSPWPSPLDALNEYGWLPAGRVSVREKMTPVSNVVPEELSGKMPAPAMVTVTAAGAHAALSA